MNEALSLNKSTYIYIYIYVLQVLKHIQVNKILIIIMYTGYTM